MESVTACRGRSRTVPAMNRAAAQGAPALRNPPVQARSRARFARICDAAGMAFDELGVERTSMEEIARRAEVSIGSVYRFFPGKDELISTLVDEYTRQHESSAMRLYAEESLARPAEVVIHEFVAGFLELVERQPGWRGLTQAGYLFGVGTLIDQWNERIDRFLQHQVPGLPRRRRAVVAATFQGLTSWLIMQAASSDRPLSGSLRETEAVLHGYVLQLRRETAPHRGAR